jgi:hypothetical protein
VTLSCEAAAGSTCGAWSDGCATIPNDKDCSLTMDADKTAGKAFAISQSPFTPPEESLVSRNELAPSLSLSPGTQSKETGETAEITGTLTAGDGSPLAGQKVRHEISGANPTSGPAELTTDVAGRAAISYVGRAGGTDTVSAYGDLDGDGTMDAGEPQATATVSWAGEPPVEQGKTANVEPIGEVLAAVPVGSMAARRLKGEARAARPPRPGFTEFVKLPDLTQLPIGSIIEARKGTARVTAAAGLAGATQTGDFGGGRFQMRQGAASPVMEMRLEGGSFQRCTRDLRRSTARTAARRIRRLRGSASGRFRTRGRRSSATVRGTQWVVEDRCDGTLTRVIEGSVLVRDFAKRRNIVLKQGRRYLARPRRR